MAVSCFSREQQPDQFIRVAWSPDGRFLATLDNDRAVKVSKAATGDLQAGPFETSAPMGSHDLQCG